MKDPPGIQNKLWLFLRPKNGRRRWPRLRRDGRSSRVTWQFRIANSSIFSRYGGFLSHGGSPVVTMVVKQYVSICFNTKMDIYDLDDLGGTPISGSPQCVCVYIYILNGTCSGGYLRPAIVEQDVVLPGFSRCSSWRFPKMGVPLFIIHFNRIVLCKPSILGYIPPFQETSISLWTLQSRRMFYAFYGREWTRMDMVWCTS